MVAPDPCSSEPDLSHISAGSCRGMPRKHQLIAVHSCLNINLNIHLKCLNSKTLPAHARSNRQSPFHHING